MADEKSADRDILIKTVSKQLTGLKGILPLEKMGEYYTKKELKYRVPKDQWEENWELLKLTRVLFCNHLPYKPLDITYVLTPEISRELHVCDQNLSTVFSQGSKPLESATEYIIEALSDEAIASSKLEGAVTTELVAKNMLRKNIPPTNNDEKMIVNNHLAMQFIKGKMDDMLTPEFIQEVQGIVTKNTLRDEEHSGVFRSTNDVYVTDKMTGEVIYYPPNTEEIEPMIAALCDFVNHDRNYPNDGESFVHPIIVGIALHFLIGYIHPFYDGNGRTARTLFYWYVLSRKYEVFAYIPISKIIQQAPAKYRDAYLATEDDDLDLTYFILYNIQCIKKARETLIRHLKLESSRKSNAEKAISVLPDVSKRQAAILNYMVEYKTEEFGIREIADRFSVTHQTARTDLIHLADSKYLDVKKKGRAYFYSVRPEWLQKID